MLKKLFYASLVTGVTVMGSSDSCAKSYNKALSDLTKKIKSLEQKIDSLQLDQETNDDELMSVKSHLIDMENNTNSWTNSFDIEPGIGLKISSKDKTSYVKLVGLLQIDWVNYDTRLNNREDFQNISTSGAKNYQFSEGISLRNLSLGLEGKYKNSWQYGVELDVKESSAELDSVYLAYNINRNLQIKLGKVEPPFTLEDSISDDNATFSEHSNGNATLEPAKSFGVNINGGGDYYSWSVGAYANSITGAGDKTDPRQDYTIAGRFALALLNNHQNLFHLGASGYRTDFSNNDSLNLEPKLFANTDNLVSPPGVLFPNAKDEFKIHSAQYIGAYGVETIVKHRSFTLQSEYQLQDITDMTYGGMKLSNYYVQASFFLTGESRSYNVRKGVLEELIPKQDFSLSKKGKGAFEIAVRYGELDIERNLLDSTPAKLPDGITGFIPFGMKEMRVKEFDIVLNHYLNKNVKLSVNYIRNTVEFLDPDGIDKAKGRDYDNYAFVGRVQLVF